MVGMTGLHFILGKYLKTSMLGKKKKFNLFLLFLLTFPIYLTSGTCWSYNGADLRPYLHPSYGKESILAPNTTESPFNLTNQSTSFMDLGKNVTKVPFDLSWPTATQNSTLIVNKTPAPTSSDTSNLNVENNNSLHGIKFQALSIATVAAFLFISNIGWVALNQVICAELLPKEIHRSANILIVGFSFLSAFISIKMFADLVQSLDAGHTFYLFGGICGVATLFTLFFVPETSQI